MEILLCFCALLIIIYWALNKVYKNLRDKTFLLECKIEELEKTFENIRYETNLVISSILRRVKEVENDR